MSELWISLWLLFLPFEVWALEAKSDSGYEQRDATNQPENKYDFEGTEINITCRKDIRISDQHDGYTMVLGPDCYDLCRKQKLGIEKYVKSDNSLKLTSTTHPASNHHLTHLNPAHKQQNHQIPPTQKKQENRKTTSWSIYVVIEEVAQEIVIGYATNQPLYEKKFCCVGKTILGHDGYTSCICSEERIYHFLQQIVLHVVIVSGLLCYWSKKKSNNVNASEELTDRIQQFCALHKKNKEAEICVLSLMQSCIHEITLKEEKKQRVMRYG